MITAERYHDISCGHRVVGHESKCAHFHGHNYRFTFTVQAPGLDRLGRVVDFSIIKSTLCEWLERHWDHKMLLWQEDPTLDTILMLDHCGVVSLPFNPTAENMADYLLHNVGPNLLRNHACELVTVRVEETRKCSATSYLI